MLKGLWIASLTAAALFLGGDGANGQTQLALAGDFLGTLRDQVTWGLASLETPKLQAGLVKNELTVVIIPAAQTNPNRPTVLVCPRNQTDLVQQTVSPADLKILTDFALEKIYQLLMDIHVLVSSAPPGGPLPPEAKEKVGDLQKRIAQLPAEKQASVKFLVGARLADLEPTQAELSKYVQTYRKQAEQRAIASLKPPGIEDLGRPQAYGAGGLTKGALNSIKEVEHFELNGQPYNKTWSGASLILVPQPKDAPPPKVSDSPLNMLGLHQDVHKAIKDAGPHKVVIKSSPIHK